MNKIVIILLLVIATSCSSSKGKVVASRNHKKVNTISPKKAVVTTKETAVVVPENNPIATSKVEVLEATSKVKVTTEMVLAYINQYKDIAKENMSKYGVPASVALGQGILESGAGTGDLSKQANNHFGIKCHKEWMGPSVRHDDDAPGECFRKYDKVIESYYDHSLFLTTRPWYEGLFRLPKNDYKGWARGLKKAGYATDPKYPEKLIGLIEKYQLQKYDIEVLGANYGLPPKKIIQEKPNDTIVKLEDDFSEVDQYVVVKGDTLFSISKKFNLTMEDLKQKNNLTNNELTLGQSLKVK
jgi:flagellum-specific peptidoglycan hydrolase FlgJ